MKKILFFLISIILFTNITLAQNANIDLNQILQTTSMPSDGEIMQMLDTLGVPQEEKNALFIETKKRLEQMYATKDASAYVDLYQNMSNISF